MDNKQTFKEFLDIIQSNMPEKVGHSRNIVPFPSEELQKIYDLGNVTVISSPTFSVGDEKYTVYSQMCKENSFSEHFINELGYQQRKYPNGELHLYIMELYVDMGVKCANGFIDDELQWIEVNIPWVRYRIINVNKNEI